MSHKRVEAGLCHRDSCDAPKASNTNQDMYKTREWNDREPL
jgi:hypothetical protein